MAVDKYPGLLEDVYNYFLNEPSAREWQYTGSIVRFIYAHVPTWKAAGHDLYVLHSAVITRCNILARQGVLLRDPRCGRDFKINPLVKST